MRDREKDGEIGREQCKRRVMDVMHIDFFFPYRRDRSRKRGFRRRRKGSGVFTIND